MPVISRFLGIAIAMFYRDHAPPHVHARYGEHEAVVDLLSARSRGDLPPKALALVREWVELNRPALLANWDRARRGEPLEPVPPLE